MAADSTCSCVGREIEGVSAPPVDSLLASLLSLIHILKAAIEAGKAIHLMGLVGTGGVHSHADHWFGVLELSLIHI